MKRADLKRVIVRILIIVVFFALGMAVGGYVAFRYSAAPFFFMNSMFRIGIATEYAGLQYSNAGYPEAREALLKLIALFDALKKEGWYEKEDNFTGRKYYVDTGLTYARLSLLEERDETISQQEAFMRQVIDRLRLAGWKDYSEQRIREVVIRQDKKNAFKKEEIDK